MKKVSQRATRVGDQIQKELADLLRNEVKDPRVGPVTVTHVDCTSDLMISGSTCLAPCPIWSIMFSRFAA